MHILKTNAEQLGLTLDQQQLEQFETYCREMTDWNTRVNLTAITDYQEMQVKHFLDSLSLIQAMDAGSVNNGASIIDIGTGAGLPGIPLKIVMPELKLTLLEATAKKTEFLRYVVSTLGLQDVDIVTGRSEDMARMERYRERFDIVTARAVSQLASLAELTLPFCAIGGKCILPKKGDISKEIEDARNAIDTLGGKLCDVKEVRLPDTDDDRLLVVIEKISPVPDKYPRRSGMPVKRPIK